MFSLNTLHFPQIYFWTALWKKEIHIFGHDTFMCASENCSSDLNFWQHSSKAEMMQLEKQWWIITRQERKGKLTPRSYPGCHPFHMSPPVPLSFHALLSVELRQDASTDGPAAACSPSGSCWHGKPLGPLPSSSFLTGGPKSVLVFRLNAKVQEPIHHQQTVKNSTHMPLHKCCWNKINPASKL